MLIVTGRPYRVSMAGRVVGSLCSPSHDGFVILATPPSKSVAADMVLAAFQQFIALGINHI